MWARKATITALFLGALGIGDGAYAEYGCPFGMTLVPANAGAGPATMGGHMTCAPGGNDQVQTGPSQPSAVDQYNSFIEDIVRNPPDFSALIPRFIDTYGAVVLATARNGKTVYYGASNYDTEAGATRTALGNCRADNARDCRLVDSFNNKVVVVIKDSDDALYLSQPNLQPDQARNEAFEACQENGRGLCLLFGVVGGIRIAR